MSIAEAAIMPPEVKNASFEQIMEGWDANYQTNFRNGPVGHKIPVLVEPKHYKLILDHTIMSDDMEYGSLYGFAKRCLPRGTHFTVWYDETAPRRDQGGEQTVLHVRWD